MMFLANVMKLNFVYILNRWHALRPL